VEKGIQQKAFVGAALLLGLNYFLFLRSLHKDFLYLNQNSLLIAIFILYLLAAAGFYRLSVRSPTFEKLFSTYYFQSGRAVTNTFLRWVSILGNPLLFVLPILYWCMIQIDAAGAVKTEESLPYKVTELVRQSDGYCYTFTSPKRQHVLQVCTYNTGFKFPELKEKEIVFFDLYRGQLGTEFTRQITTLAGH
jgi:hypothetical protein